jgi:hypothetical protein
MTVHPNQIEQLNEALTNHPDQITRELWYASLAVRGIAVASGFHRAPVSWVAWSVFMLVTGIACKYLDGRMHDPYLWVWMAQQIGGILLLAVIVWRTVKPPMALVYGSCIAAMIVSLMASVIAERPHDALGNVMFEFGTATLALGLCAGVTAIARGYWRYRILTAYLLLSALLELAGGEFLGKVGLGRAWELNEILCFGAWAVLWRMDGSNRVRN